MSVQKAGWNFVEMAVKQNKRLMSLPLRDKSTAKVLWNNNAVDCFIIRKGRVKEGRGAAGSPDHVSEEMARIFDKLEHLVEPGVDVFKSFISASFK